MRRLALLAALAVVGLVLACDGAGEPSRTATPGPPPSGTPSPAGTTPTSAAQGEYPPKVSLTEPGVYLVRPDGSGLRQLASGEGRFRSIWSPDGSHIAVVGIVGGAHRVSVIDVDDGAEVAVFDGSGRGPELWVGNPLWSPDGRQLVVPAGPYQETTGWHAYLVNADGSGEPIDLFEGSLLRWSPDGSVLAFVDYSEKGVTLQTFDLTTHTATIIERAIGLDSFAWSPDSQRMAYTIKLRLPNFEAVVVIDRDGFNRRVMAEGVSRPEWSPNGEYLAFIDHGGRVAVAQMTISSYPVRLAPRRAVVTWWSPKGDAILIWETSSLSLLSLATREAIEPTDVAAGVVPTGSASFSPDGQRVAFTGHESAPPTTDPGDLFIANADGTALEKLVEPSVGMPWGPVWSPDGRYIAFVNGPTAIS